MANGDELKLKRVMINPDTCAYVFAGGGVTVKARDDGCLGEINSLDITNNNPEASRPPPITLDDVKKQIEDFNSAVNRIFEERLPERYSEEVLDPLKKALNIPLRMGKAAKKGSEDIPVRAERARFFDPHREGYAIEFGDVQVLITGGRLERFDHLPMDEGLLTPHEKALLSLLILLRKEKAE